MAPVSATASSDKKRRKGNNKNEGTGLIYREMPKWGRLRLPGGSGTFGSNPRSSSEGPRAWNGRCTPARFIWSRPSRYSRYGTESDDSWPPPAGQPIARLTTALRPKPGSATDLPALPAFRSTLFLHSLHNDDTSRIVLTFQFSRPIAHFFLSIEAINLSGNTDLTSSVNMMEETRISRAR